MPTTKELCCTCAALMAFKLLLAPAYTSTDFEVHRNWLAVTTLPLSEWYTESTSQWTLDYPPVFGWFEWGLSRIARLLDEQMVQISRSPYASPTTVLFQRVSVVATDVVLLSGVHAFAAAARTKTPRKQQAGRWDLEWLLGGMVLANAGLVVVDNVHFQYNGLLFGIQLISLAFAWEGRFVAAGACFALLLQLKHIFLYVAPAYFVFLLSAYCCKSPGILRTLCPSRLARLGGVVLGVFSASLGPFLWNGQLGPMAERLFPFTRGLSHAYWAPNVWALYNAADRVLVKLGGYFGLLTGRSGFDGPTRGLVQDVVHEVLPAVHPGTCAALLLVCILPALWALFRDPRRDRFLACVGFCAMSSFQLGWHVHEKAALMIVVPLLPLAVLEIVDGGREEDEAGSSSPSVPPSNPPATLKLRAAAPPVKSAVAKGSNRARRLPRFPVWRLCALLSILTDLTVLPLLHRPIEIVLRTILVATHACAIFWTGRSARCERGPSNSGRAGNDGGPGGWLCELEGVYYCGLVFVELVTTLILPYFAPSFPFLPLLVRSTFYSVGFLACWGGTAWLAMR